MRDSDSRFSFVLPSRTVMKDTSSLRSLAGMPLKEPVSVDLLQLMLDFSRRFCQTHEGKKSINDLCNSVTRCILTRTRPGGCLRGCLARKRRVFAVAQPRKRARSETRGSSVIDGARCVCVPRIPTWTTRISAACCIRKTGYPPQRGRAGTPTCSAEK